MSNRKTRSKKIKYQQKFIQKRELERLKQEVIELQNQIKDTKKKNIKNFYIRNLKIFGYACNFVAPLVLTTGLSIGTVKVLGGGYPFVLDKVEKYKVYSLDYLTDEVMNMNEWYQTNRWYSKSLDSNELKTYSPWQKNGEMEYFRTVREYSIDNNVNVDLIDAVLEQNMDYIFENYDSFDEQREYTNIEQVFYDKYIIDTYLNIMDETDSTMVDELKSDNTRITILQLFTSLGIGGFIMRGRYSKIESSMKTVKNKYQNQPIEPLEMKLEETQRKVLSLTKGGTKNDK